MSHQLATGAKVLMGLEVIPAIMEYKSQRERWGEPSLPNRAVALTRRRGR